jgi:nicotinamide mononucleotide transporter
MMLEYIAVAFNIAYVVLASRRNIWCWPMGIVGSLLSIFLFIEVKIYAEAILFTYYVVMGFYGWYLWKKSEGEEGLMLSTRSLSYHLLLFSIGYVLSFGMYVFLESYTPAEMPLLDSYTTVFSFIATWLVAKKILENWIYWIAIDSLTVYLYLARGLELYALLSLVYTGMAVYGYLEWRKRYLSHRKGENLV